MNVSGFWWDYHRVDGIEGIDYIQAAYITDEIKDAMSERTFWGAFERELVRGSPSVSFVINNKRISYVYIGEKKLVQHNVKVFCLDSYTEKERREILGIA